MTATNDSVMESLIRDEWPRLRRFFRTKVADPDVLDVTQATLLAFVEGRARATSSEKAYLWGIARLQVLKYYERQRGSEAFDSGTHGVKEVSRSLSSRLDARDRLARALHKLPVDHQMAFELRHGEELSLEEVADAVGVSLATIKRYLSAAEASLRAELGEGPDALGAAYSAL